LTDISLYIYTGTMCINIPKYSEYMDILDYNLYQGSQTNGSLFLLCGPCTELIPTAKHGTVQF